MSQESLCEGSSVSGGWILSLSLFFLSQPFKVLAGIWIWQLSQGQTGKQASDVGSFLGTHSTVSAMLLSWPALASFSNSNYPRYELAWCRSKQWTWIFKWCSFNYSAEIETFTLKISSLFPGLFANLVNRTSLGKSSFLKPPYFLTDAINMTQDPAIWKTLLVTSKGRLVIPHFITDFMTMLRWPSSPK